MDVIIDTVTLTPREAAWLAPWTDPWVEIYLRWRYGPGYLFYLNHWQHCHELLY